MAIFWVRPANGNDGNAGTSFALAKKTTVAAIALLASSGDQINLVEEGAESTATKIVLQEGSVPEGSWAKPIRFVGVNSSGVEDGTRYRIEASDAISSVLELDAPFGAHTYQFRNIDFDGNSLAVAAVDDINSYFRVTWDNCNFRRATGPGFSTSTLEHHDFSKCRFFSNGTFGFQSRQVNKGQSDFNHCWFYGNGSGGAWFRDGHFIVVDSLFHSNTGPGCFCDGSQCREEKFLGCLFQGNIGNGLDLGQAFFSVVSHCSFSDNGDLGLSWSHADTLASSLFSYNHSYNNTNGASTGGDLPGLFNQTGDPLFIDASNFDFHPYGLSPLLGNGAEDTDLGPFPASTSGLASSVPTNFVDVAAFTQQLLSIGFHEALANSILYRIDQLLVITKGYTVVYDDVEPDIDPTDVWIRATVLDGDSDQIDLGGSTITDRTDGIVAFQVFGPADKGGKDVRAVVDVIKVAFRRISSGGVTYLTPSVLRIGRKGDEIQFNVNCPFYSEHQS